MVPRFQQTFYFLLLSLSLIFFACGETDSTESYRSSRGGAKQNSAQTKSQVTRKTTKPTADSSTQQPEQSEQEQEEENLEEEMAEEEEVADEASPQEEPPKLSFAQDVAPVVEVSCLGGCHPGIFTGRRDLTTFEGVKECGTICVEQIDNGSMPQGRDMTPDQKALFKKWVADGALP